jgi:hypothetical protein
LNRLLRQHLDATFFDEYQALRGQLMDVLSDADLAFDLGGGTLTLGALCREMGEVEQAYIDSFRTFRRDFSYRYPDPAIERDRDALVAWFHRLDTDLLAALDALSNEDVRDRHIEGADFDPGAFSPSPAVQLDIYREALLIFYAKVSVYLRAFGIALPGNWASWIG